MKKMLITILIIVGICLFFTGFIIFVNMETKGSNSNLSGSSRYDEAYITSCSGGYVKFVYDGDEYVGEGQLQYEYTGKANIVIKDGRIRKVYAIIESANTVAADKLSTESVLPANGEQISIDYISVLLKNGSSIFFDDINIKSHNSMFIAGKDIGKEFNASNYFNGNTKKKVLVYNDDSALFKNRNYEGNFVISKTKDGYVIVNQLPVETYLKYVIPSEMPQSFNHEALKTQAICARTFAYKSMETPAYPEYNADLDDSTSYQVYNSGGTYDSTDKAVEDTDKKVIYYKNKLITCYYFSTSSGYTENMSVWKTKSPKYIKSVESKDDNSPYFRWTAKVNCNSIINSEYGKLISLKVMKKSNHGYVIKLKAVYENGEITYDDENKIRRFLGCGLESLLLYDGSSRYDMSSLPSACFTIGDKVDGYFTINGAGFGHGIGMSQYGANKLASGGKKCEDIIKYYYRNVTIEEITNIY